MCVSANMDSNGVKFRAARLEDYTAVINMKAYIKIGFDSLSHLFMTAIKDPNRFCFIALRDDKVVSKDALSPFIVFMHHLPCILCPIFVCSVVFSMHDSGQTIFRKKISSDLLRLSKT